MFLKKFIKLRQENIQGRIPFDPKINENWELEEPWGFSVTRFDYNGA